MRIDAVVFDLDDTLIDTTGQLLAPAHRDAAAAMIAAGLPGTLAEVAEAREQLARAEPGADVDRRVAALLGAPDPEAVARAGHDAFYRRTVRSLDPFPFVPAVLDAVTCRRFVLTAGDPGTQARKLELTGLTDRFEEVVCVGPREGKEAALVALLHRYALRPEHVVVVGDRVDREIEAARGVGAWAVRVVGGEGGWGEPAGAAQQPHYTVPSLESLPGVLEDLASRDDLPDDG